MLEKANLREANLNGAIIADAKLGGARLDEGFCGGTSPRFESSSPPWRHTHTDNDFIPTDVTAHRRLSTPLWGPSRSPQ